METDVAVVGGGPAGAAAALTLLRYTALRVAVVERSRYDDVRVGETVPPGLLPLLQYLGVREAFEADGHLPAHGTGAAWGGPGVADSHFLFTARGDGWHLDRARFDRTLAAGVGAAGGTVLRGTRLAGCARDGGGAWNLALAGADGAPAGLRARYVVDASGKRAVVARQAGARRQVHDRLVGVTAYWEGPADGSHTTLVESVPGGWWYSAMLPDGRLACALMSDVDLVRDAGVHRAQAFAAALAEAPRTRERVGGARLSGGPVVRPAQSQVLRPAAGAGWAAAGDAAAAFDPLSSMGIGHALSSGIQAARVALDAVEHGSGLTAAYAADTVRHFEHYLGLRRTFYAVERRWPDSPFWARRTGAPAAMPAPA